MHLTRALILAALLAALRIPGIAAEEAPPSLVAGPESDLVKELMSLVRAAADVVDEKGPEPACREFSEPGPWFQGESYVFVLDMEGNALCHPSRPELVGRNLLDLRDPLGKPIVASFIRELGGDREDGWVHYLWPRPGHLTSFWKTSYVRRATGPAEGEYIVGSGLYELEMERFFIVEQVRDAVRLISEEGEGAFATLRDPAGGFVFYDAYVFVVDSGGKMLVNAASPDLEGSDVGDLVDAKGTPILQQMLTGVADREWAWIDYQWPRPGSETPRSKSSFIHRVALEGRDLIVGAGVYSD